MAKEIIVYADGRLVCDGATYRCALGPNGVSQDKKEGDGCTPAGTFPLREGFYRHDRLPRPETQLSMRELTPTDGWCDDSADAKYNTLVELPYGASHEKLWREDHIYDTVIPLGYNDEPPVPGKGSAIFFHLAREAYTPTEGCIAVSLQDMLEILRSADASTVMTIVP